MAYKNQGPAPRALVVEDIKVDCAVLLRMLRKLNCEATVAQNGKEAVDLFREGKTSDIVSFDKDMPVMTGPEVLQLLSRSKFIFFSFFLSTFTHFSRRCRKNILFRIANHQWYFWVNSFVVSPYSCEPVIMKNTYSFYEPRELFLFIPTIEFFLLQ